MAIKSRIRHERKKSRPSLLIKLIGNKQVIDSHPQRQAKRSAIYGDSSQMMC